MRVFITVLVLIFSLQSFTKADDISDFEIEGMSIGDSLLDYMDEEKIKNSKKNYYPGSKKFFQINFWNIKNSETYEHLSFIIKENDKNYIIYSSTGTIDYKKNINDCYKKEKIIINDIKKLVNTDNVEEYGKSKHQYDKTGESTKTVTQFYFNNGGVIKTSCVDWSDSFEKKGEIDALAVSISSEEAFNWYINEAYK